MNRNLVSVAILFATITLMFAKRAYAADIGGDIWPQVLGVIPVSVRFIAVVTTGIGVGVYTVWRVLNRTMMPVIQQIQPPSSEPDSPNLYSLVKTLGTQLDGLNERMQLSEEQRAELSRQTYDLNSRVYKLEDTARRIEGSVNRMRSDVIETKEGVKKLEP
jgi:hypothetical protein